MLTCCCVLPTDVWRTRSRNSSDDRVRIARQLYGAQISATLLEVGRQKLHSGLRGYLFAYLVYLVRTLQRAYCERCGEVVESELGSHLRRAFEPHAVAHHTSCSALRLVLQSAHGVVERLRVVLAGHEAHGVHRLQFADEPLLLLYAVVILRFGRYIRIVIEHCDAEILRQILYGIAAARRATTVQEQRRRLPGCRVALYYLVKSELIVYLVHNYKRCLNDIANLRILF